MEKHTPDALLKWWREKASEKKKKKQTAFREQSSHFGELPSSEMSRTPFLTRTRKRIIAPDAENEKRLTQMFS